MKFGAFGLVVVVSLLVPRTVAAQSHEGPLSRLAARFHAHQHVHAQAAVAPPAALASQPVSGQCSTGADPYGFMALFNRVRARSGLPPVSYDPSLSSWARRNNLAQCVRGLGHHVSPGVGVQNCAWNYPDAGTTVEGWMNSPGHRQNMLAPDISRFGIAFGPGPYWTLNAR